MVAAVRGARMDINDDGDNLIVVLKEWGNLSLLQIAEAFGFLNTDTYLDALEREGPRIFRRMRW